MSRRPQCFLAIHLYLKTWVISNDEPACMSRRPRCSLTYQHHRPGGKDICLHELQISMLTGSQYFSWDSDVRAMGVPA